FFQAEDGIRDRNVTGVQTCALPIWLVYATCSLEPEENDAVAQAFLAAKPDFRVDPPEGFPLPLDSDGWLRCLPHRHGTDGFSAVRFRRSELSGITAP